MVLLIRHHEQSHEANHHLQHQPVIQATMFIKPSPQIDAGRSGGKQTTIITQATTHNTSTNYSTKSSNINTTPTKNINIVVNNTPPTTHTPNASPSSLIKGFFMRKRHKSVGSASIPSPVCKRHDVIMTSLNGGITSGSGGASTKIKNFFFGASRHRRKTSESVVSVSIVPEMNKSRGSLSTTPPHTANPLLPTSEPPLGGLGVLTEGVSSPPRVLFGGSIYNTKPLSDLPRKWGGLVCVVVASGGIVCCLVVCIYVQ